MHRWLAERAALGWHGVVPKRLLTRVAGHLANKQKLRVTPATVKRFVRRYGVDLAEAHYSDIADYGTFNDFFSRRLKPGARKIADAPMVCPVDGVVSQFGNITDGQLLQAKGHYYAVSELLANEELAQAFLRGSYATFYLSPKDYHRVHMPCDGQLQSMTYVPGRFYSVNLRNAASVPGLFARNERVVCTFKTGAGLLAVVFVGATIVGSVVTTWHGLVRSPHGRRIYSWQYRNGLTCKKGDEIGRFVIGSTVIVLTAFRVASFNAAWNAGKSVRLGEPMSVG